MDNLLQLRYGSIVVGEIIGHFCHQNTWFGLFHQTLIIPGGPTEQPLGEFIAFCEEWHARSVSGEDVDPSEFDRFGDLISSGMWRTEAPDGTLRAIHEAPVFCGGEVTWHYHPGQSEPGRATCA